MATAANGADLEMKAAVDNTEVALGEMIEITVSVTNKDVKPTKVKELGFGRGFVEFEVTLGEGSAAGPVRFTYTRIPGGVYDPKQPADVSLKAGETLTERIALPALLPGKTTITGVVWGRVQLDTLSVQVDGKGKEPRLRIETDHGTMEARLLPRVAPNTCANIALLAHQGFYKGIVFHRIIEGFMIQGGCPEGTGTGGPGFSLPAEFNKEKHVKGTLSMARSSHNDSAGSQFFVVHGPAPFLDNKYTVFGELVSGLDTLDKLAGVPVKQRGNEKSAPVKPPVIKSMTFTAGAAE